MENVVRYTKTIVKPPIGLEVGAKIGILGEANDVFTISEIIRREDGTISNIIINDWSREPLSKIYLLRGRSHDSARQDATSWFKAIVGECDICKKQFPDSCSYRSNPDNPDSMICFECKTFGNISILV